MSQAIPALLMPGISPEHHGPRVVIVGGIMLSATILMITVAMYTRYNAGTTHRLDVPLLLSGVAIDIGCYAIICQAVTIGFGDRIAVLDATAVKRIEKLFLGSILVFFISHGIIKISYNLLARHTARSRCFKLAMDALSAFIACWAAANVVVISISLHNDTSPQQIFFWISGAFSIAIVLAQLSAFLFVIWSTQAKLSVKLRWSLSMGAFVPLCIASIITRLVYTPNNYFTADWTFDRVLQAMLFQIELNLMTITVLAPNLPVFFQKTSTGGVFFLPGEATHNSRRDTDNSVQNDVDVGRMRWSHIQGGGVFDGSKQDDTITSTASRSNGTASKLEKIILDSDVILMRRSFEVDRSESRGEESSSGVVAV